MRTGTAIFLFAALLAMPAPGLAADGEHALSATLGYATYTVVGDNPHGAALGVDYERGFSDALSWRISGGGGFYYRDGVSFSGQLTAGLTYLFDVLKYVPYVNAGIGGIVIVDIDGDPAGDPAVDIHPLAEIGVGLDILRDRTSSVGVYVRFETLLQETSFFTAGVRSTWRWGFF
jgi:hypothetical protein